MPQIKTLEELDKIASNKNIEICYATVIDDDFSYYDKNRKYSSKIPNIKDIRQGIFIFPVIIKKQELTNQSNYYKENEEETLSTSFTAETLIDYYIEPITIKTIKKYKDKIDKKIDNNYIEAISLLQYGDYYIKNTHTILNIYQNCIDNVTKKHFSGYISSFLGNNLNVNNIPENYKSFFIDNNISATHIKLFTQYDSAKYFIQNILDKHILYCCDIINRKADTLKLEYINLKNTNI